MNYFIKKNVNPLGKSTGDCVIRSFVIASGFTWDYIFMDLCVIGLNKKCMLNDKEAYQQWLKDHGYIYTGISNKKGSKRPTVLEFCKQHKENTYVLVLANHLVTCRDGKYIDSWDCGNKCLYGYWKKQ